MSCHMIKCLYQISLNSSPQVFCAPKNYTAIKNGTNSNIMFFYLIPILLKVRPFWGPYILNFTHGNSIFTEGGREKQALSNNLIVI